MWILSQRTPHIQPAKISSFSYLNLSVPWLALHSTWCLTSLRHTQFNTVLSPIWKWLMDVEHKHQDTYNKTIFYRICRISFSHNCHIEKSAVWVCISPPVLITVTSSCEKVKQVTEKCEWAGLSCVKVTSHLFGRPCDCYVIAYYCRHIFMTVEEAELYSSQRLCRRCFW
jgi:hypothetical protein